MAATTIRKCDFCGKEITQVAAKLYLAPILPGKASTSFMAGYSHSADVCDKCLEDKFIPKMTRRKPRENGNGADKKKTKKKARA